MSARADFRDPRPSPSVYFGIASGALVVMLAAYVAGPLAIVPLGLATVGLWTWLTQATVLRWDVLMVTIVCVIMFIPIGRYALPGNLPFELEPYRVLVAFVATAWICSLLVQSEVRLKPTGLGGPLSMLCFSILASITVNADSIHAQGLDSYVLKALTFFGSFLVVLLFANSTLTTREKIDRVLGALVITGAVVGVFTAIESRTSFNIFNHLQTFIPVLQFLESGVPGFLELRGDGARAIASSQHPIALGAVLALLVPVGASLAIRLDKRWWIPTSLLVVGVFTTVARTAVLMLLVEAIVLLCLKPRTMIRLWPMLLPCLLAIHVVSPGALGGVKSAFMPSGGLVAEQHEGAGTYGSNRLADVGPTLAEWRKQPLFGQGFGSRVADRSDPHVNAKILDDQWLASLAETGLAGVLSLVWLFGRAVRKLCRFARSDASDESWTAAAIAAAVAGFAVGMLTYDAFSFTQVVLVTFILMGVGMAATRLPALDPVASRPKRSDDGARWDRLSEVVKRGATGRSTPRWDTLGGPE